MSIRQFLVTISDDVDDSQEVSVRAVMATVPSGMQVQLTEMDTSYLEHSLRIELPLVFEGRTPRSIPFLSMLHNRKSWPR